MAVTKGLKFQFATKRGSRRVTAAVRFNKTNKQISELGNAAKPADTANNYDHV